MTVYYLAVKQIPELLSLFPHFISFSILATVVGIPTGVVIGWLHMKRSRAYSSEVDIAVESNPYNYKAPPGRDREISIPWILLTLDMMEALAAKHDVLTPEMHETMEKLRRLNKALMKGGDYRVAV